MKVKININPDERTVEVRPVKDPAKEKLEGLSELAILGGGFMSRIVDGKAINVDDVRRYNLLCYQFLGQWQDGGEFYKEKAPEAEPKARADGGRIPFAERRSVYEVAIDRYGIEAQLRMVIEEMSELTKELCKFFRGKDNLDDIADETADVAIMLEQLQLIFGINDKVCEHRDAKVQRLAGKLGIEVHDGKRSEMR